MTELASAVEHPDARAGPGGDADGNGITWWMSAAASATGR